MKILKTLIYTLLLLLLTQSAQAQFFSSCITGEISLIGSAADELCQEDLNSSTLRFRARPLATPYFFMVVDANDIIVYLGLSNNIDFSELPAGTLRVYAVSFSGNILGEVGDNYLTTELASICYELTENFITISSLVPEGGNVSTADGADELTVCIADGVDNAFQFITDTDFDPYLFVVTDENNQILDTSADGIVDFSGAAVGVCRVWGLGLVGDFLGQPGDNLLTTDLASGCYELSANFVEVTRLFPEGGEVTFVNANDDYLYCGDVPSADILELTNDQLGSTAYTYLVINENDNVVAIEDALLSVGGLGAGDFRVVGLAYTGNLTVSVGDVFDANNLSDECSDLSDNQLTIRQRILSAGSVSLADGGSEAIVCVGDGNADALDFANTASGDGEVAYVITDENNMVLGINTTGTIDFEGAPAGVCRVWVLTYTGNLLLAADDNLNNTTAFSEECFDLSANFVTISRNAPAGGSVSLADGSTSFVECMAGSGATVLDLLSMGANPNLDYAYIVVDENSGIIVGITTDNAFDLSTIDLGTYAIHGVSFLDNLTVEVGDTFAGAELADLCFDLSSNSIEVINRSVTLNALNFTDGSTVATICPDDGAADVLSYVTDYTGTDNLVYLITDNDDVLLEVTTSTSSDFSDFTGEFVRIYAAAFTGNFTLSIGTAISPSTVISDDCYDLANNFLLVDLRGPEGGEISFTDGTTSAIACVADGQPDLLTVQNTSPAGTNYVYLITNLDREILDIRTSATLDFENVPAGICQVYGLAYIGNLLAEVGMDLDDEPFLSTQCFDLSDNFTEIGRIEVDGGQVTLDNGSTLGFACSNDGEADFFVFENNTTATNLAYSYVVTDELNNILAVLDANSINLDQAAPGNCRIWGLSYTGNIIAENSQNVLQVELSDECYELSNNFISIQREEVNGGNVSLADGSDFLYVCVGDGVADSLMFVNDGITTANYSYYITDADNNILSNIGAGMLDFDNVNLPEEVRVWGVAFSGLPNAPMGDIETAELSNRCYDVSDNFVTIIRTTPNGGEVSTEDGLTNLSLCTDDGIDDLFAFEAVGLSNTPFAWVVTNEEGTILDILTDNNEVNFEGAPEGTCFVYGLAYIGEISVAAGDNINQPMADVCYDLSDNAVEVKRGDLQAGTISGVTGTADIFTCPGDGNPDPVNFSVQGAGTGSYAYLLTNENNDIISVEAITEIDFENLATGEYRIHGLIYTGDLLAAPGLNAGAELATGCYDLTDNFLTVINDSPAGGLLVAEDSQMDTIRICIGDGIPDPFTIDVFGSSEAAYAFLVTELDGSLVGILEGPEFDFEMAAPGDWNIYGVSYTGALSILPGGNIFEDALANGCAELSTNAIYVDKTAVSGGLVRTDFGADQVFICPDGEPDITNFVTTGGTDDDEYAFVLTTGGNIVLQVLNGSAIDFEEAAGLDNLRMWGISYTGELQLSIGNVLTDVVPADGCYDLSDNFVEIFLDQPEGGVISFENGADSLRFCHSNFMSAVQLFTTSSASVGYAYLLTDDMNQVINTFPTTDGLVSMDDVAPGFYRLWGVSYTGILNDVTGQDAATATIATSCFELSENFLVIERTESLDGGNVGTESGEETIIVCPQNGQPDIVILTNDTDDPNYRYIITDDQNNIIFGDVENPVINFDPALPGVCRVWGVTYTGEFDPPFMVDITTATLSSDCWALSNNFLTIVRNIPDAGDVTTDEGSVDVEIFTNDGVDDVVTFVNTGVELTPYVYVITNEFDEVLEVSTDGIVNFEGVPAGVCHVWGVSYTGELTVQAGDLITEVELSDDCFDLSGNFVVVTRLTEIEPLVSSIVTTQETAPQVRLEVYPNPAVNMVNLRVAVPADQLDRVPTVSVFDLSGTLLFERTLGVADDTQTTQLDISQLQSGMYLLRWYNGQEVVTERFMKL